MDASEQIRSELEGFAAQVRENVSVLFAPAVNDQCWGEPAPRPGLVSLTCCERNVLLPDAVGCLHEVESYTAP